MNQGQPHKVVEPDLSTEAKVQVDGACRLTCARGARGNPMVPCMQETLRYVTGPQFKLCYRILQNSCLALADALLVAVKKRADGDAQRSLAVALIEELLLQNTQPALVHLQVLAQMPYVRNLQRDLWGDTGGMTRGHVWQPMIRGGANPTWLQITPLLSALHARPTASTCSVKRRSVSSIGLGAFVVRAPPMLTVRAAPSNLSTYVCKQFAFSSCCTCRGLSVLMVIPVPDNF